MNNIDNKDLITLASYAGQIILENGGETYRVEETIKRILFSYGIINAESFATPTVIIVSIIDDAGEIISLTKRVSRSTVDLEKITLVNNLSRKLEENPLQLSLLKKELDLIEDKTPYKTSTQLLMAALLTSSFTLLLGGNSRDAILSFIIGPGLLFIQLTFKKYNLNAIFTNIIGGSYAAIIVLILTKLSFFNTKNIDLIIVGCVMVLVPGIAFTNAMRDTLMGDYLSGSSRAVEALLTAVGIAVGVGSVFFFSGLWR